MSTPPTFDGAFQERLKELLIWRRDVRHFRTDPIAPDVVEDLLAQACLSPSVGNSQPWRFVLVEDSVRREGVKSIFSQCNQQALEAYHGEQAKLYASLKLAGLDKAPVQIAVFAETAPEEGAGLGRQTMPQTLQYSVAAAVQTLFLVARAQGIGVGMISIIDPEAAAELLDVPASWEFVSYLCLGLPEEEHDVPELERVGWQEKVPLKDLLFRR